MKLFSIFLVSFVSLSAFAKKSYIFRSQAEMDSSCAIQVVVTPFKDQFNRDFIEIQKEQYGNACQQKCTMCEGSEFVKLVLSESGDCLVTYMAESKNAFINSKKMDGAYASDSLLELRLPQAERAESCKDQTANVDVYSSSIYAETAKQVLSGAEQTVSAQIQGVTFTSYQLFKTRD